MLNKEVDSREQCVDDYTTMGTNLQNFKVALAKSNNTFLTFGEMYELLLTDYLNNLVSNEHVISISESLLSERNLDLMRLSTLTNYISHSFDKNTKDYAELMSCFPHNLFLYYFYQMSDYKWVKRFRFIILESVGSNIKFSVKFSAFEEWLTSNKKYGFRWRMLKDDFKTESVDESTLFTPHMFEKQERDQFMIRLVSSSKIDLKGILKRQLKVNEKLQSHFKRVIIHIHGGGYIAMSSSSHQSYLRKFAKQTGAAVFSIDYPLAPSHKFVSIFESVVKGYLYILVD